MSSTDSSASSDAKPPTMPAAFGQTFHLTNETGMDEATFMTTAAGMTVAASGSAVTDGNLIPPPPENFPQWLPWPEYYQRILSEGPTSGTKIPHPPTYWPQGVDWPSTYQRIFPLGNTAAPRVSTWQDPFSVATTANSQHPFTHVQNASMGTCAKASMVGYPTADSMPPLGPRGGSGPREAIVLNNSVNVQDYFGQRGPNGSLFEYAGKIMWSFRNNTQTVMIPRDMFATNRSSKNNPKHVQSFYHLRCRLITDQGYTVEIPNVEAPHYFAETLDTWADETVAWAKPQVIRFLCQHAHARFGWTHQGRVPMNLNELGQALVACGDLIAQEIAQGSPSSDAAKEAAVTRRQEELYYLCYELWKAKYNGWLCGPGGLTAHVLDDNNLTYDDNAVLREGRKRMTSNQLDSISAMIKNRVAPNIRTTLQTVAENTFGGYIQNRDRGAKTTRVAKRETTTGIHMGYRCISNSSAQVFGLNLDSAPQGSPSPATGVLTNPTGQTTMMSNPTPPTWCGPGVATNASSTSGPPITIRNNIEAGHVATAAQASTTSTLPNTSEALMANRMGGANAVAQGASGSLAKFPQQFQQHGAAMSMPPTGNQMASAQRKLAYPEMIAQYDMAGAATTNWSQRTSALDVVQGQGQIPVSVRGTLKNIETDPPLREPWGSRSAVDWASAMQGTGVVQNWHHMKGTAVDQERNNSFHSHDKGGKANILDADDQAPTEPLLAAVSHESADKSEPTSPESTTKENSKADKGDPKEQSNVSAIPLEEPEEEAHKEGNGTQVAHSKKSVKTSKDNKPATKPKRNGQPPRKQRSVKKPRDKQELPKKDLRKAETPSKKKSAASAPDSANKKGKHGTATIRITLSGSRLARSHTNFVNNTGYVVESESEDEDFECEILKKECPQRYMESSYKADCVEPSYFVPKFKSSYYTARCIKCRKRFSNVKKDVGDDVIKPNNSTQQVRVCEHFETGYPCAIICNPCFMAGKIEFKEQINELSSTPTKNNRKRKKRKFADEDDEE